MEPTTMLLLGGLYLFGPRPKKLFQPKPDMQAVAAAQADADAAKALQAKAEAELSQLIAQLKAKDEAERQKQTEILQYGQQTNEMASVALSRVPLEHRTSEVELAAEMVGRTGVALTTILGQLRPEQQRDLLDMVSRLLSKQAEERARARAELMLKDKQLEEASRDRAILLKEKTLLETTVGEKAAQVELTKAERDAKDAELRNKNQQALQLMQKLGENDGWFWRMLLWGVGIWLWFTRVLPALSKSFAWAKCLDGFNQFIFRLIVGSSNK